MFLIASLLTFAVFTSSCSRKCKGGGWYGDRNLGYTPVKEKPADTIHPIITEDSEDECTTTP